MEVRKRSPGEADTPLPRRRRESPEASQRLCRCEATATGSRSPRPERPSDTVADLDLEEFVSWARGSEAAGDALTKLVRRGVVTAEGEAPGPPRGWRALALLRDIKALRREAPSNLPDLRGVPGIPAASPLPSLFEWSGFQTAVATALDEAARAGARGARGLPLAGVHGPWEGAVGAAEASALSHARSPPSTPGESGFGFSSQG